MFSVISTLSPVSRVAASTREQRLTASPITLNERRPAPPIAPGDDRAGVHPHPDLEAPGPAAVDRPRHLHGALHRAVRMVRQPLGRAEDGEHRVADELVDVAVVAGDDRDDALEELVQPSDDVGRLRLGGRGR